MGQKVSPNGLRIGIIREWDAKWYAPKTKVADLLLEDLKIRDFLNDFYKAAYVSRIEIKRTGRRVVVLLHAAKPGIVIGSGGSKKNEAVKKLEKLFVKEILVDQGATLKRFRARAKGSGNRILKRTSHITVVVSDGLE